MCGEAVALVDYMPRRELSRATRATKTVQVHERGYEGSLCLGVHGAWAAWHGMAWHGSQTVIILVCTRATDRAAQRGRETKEGGVGLWFEQRESATATARTQPQRKLRRVVSVSLEYRGKIGGFLRSKLRAALCVWRCPNGEEQGSMPVEKRYRS